MSKDHKKKQKSQRRTKTYTSRRSFYGAQRSRQVDQDILAVLKKYMGGFSAHFYIATYSFSLSSFCRYRIRNSRNSRHAPS